MRTGQDVGTPIAPTLSEPQPRVVSGEYSTIISAESFAQLCAGPQDDGRWRFPHSPAR